MKKIMLISAVLLFGLNSIASSFPNQNITFIIPYGPGGGNDTIARLTAPSLEKHLGGNVSVVPTNLAGAGGQRGATAVYRANPDGYTIGLFPMPGLALPEVLGEPVEFNLRNMTWLGRIEASYYVLLVPANSTIRTLDDFKDGREIRFASTGFGATMLVASQMTAGALNIPADFITGYTSSSDALAGVLRGDANAAMGIIEPSLSFIESGDLRAIAVSAAHPSLPNVPTFEELGYPELNVLSLDRWVGAPPNLPQEIRETLEEALKSAIADSDFVQQALRSNITPAYLSGNEVEALIEENFRFFDEFKDLLQNPANQ